jgi:glycosyltransferase involved in cell wall biosynthesis
VNLTFSVLIAAYRAAGTIGAALECVGTQSHSAWELIVVEDGSSDGTEALVRAFAARHPSHRIVYDNPGANRGVAAARTRLLALARGDAVAFLDADDLWDPDHLASLAATLAAGADLAVAGIRLVELGTGRDLGTYTPPSRLWTDPVRTLFERSAIMTSTAVGLRRDLCARVGPFREELRVGEDRDYWLRTALAGGQLRGTGRITATYHKHAASTMARTRTVAEHTLRFYVLHAHEAAVPRGLRQRCLHDALVVQGRLCRAVQPAESLKHLRRAVRLRPWNLATWLQLLVSLRQVRRQPSDTAAAGSR